MLQDRTFINNLYALCATYKHPNRVEVPADKACKVCGCHINPNNQCLMTRNCREVYQ